MENREKREVAMSRWSRWTGFLRESIRREPGPWILAAAGLLGVALWHVPVPPFIFADGGSGSTSACTCSANNCKSWELVPPGSENCDTPPWEGCTPDMEHMVDCVPPPTELEKKMPKSKFTYETNTVGGGRCLNTGEHGGDPNGTNYEDEVVWKRDDVAVSSAGTSGQKRIEFRPQLTVSFDGFSDGNVCPGSTGQIEIRSGFFAKMSVCATADITDPAKSMGWGYATHHFRQISGVWQFDAAAGAADPYTETFAISHTCSCTAGDDDPDEEIKFKSRIADNSGVLLGHAGNDGIVLYRATADATTCTAVNP
jgi:hypothetical protein